MISSTRFSRTFAIFISSILVIVATVSVGAQQHRPQPPKTLRLYILDCGVINGRGPQMSVPCYLIAGPRGTMMWDVGSIPDAAFKDDGKPVTMGIFYATRTLKSQLAEIGYTPSEINYLALSHAHADHIANSNQFAKSTWLVRQAERDMLFSQKPPQIDEYSELKNSNTLLIASDEFDVFGDGKAIIKFAPGHTPGHSVLILKLAKTGNVLLTGDLYHYPEEIQTNATLGNEYNKEQTMASRAMILDYVKKTNTQMWIEHDSASNAKLRKSPKYYD